jgi:hypothetical protein
LVQSSFLLRYRDSEKRDEVDEDVVLLSVRLLLDVLVVVADGRSVGRTVVEGVRESVAGVVKPLVVGDVA